MFSAFGVDHTINKGVDIKHLLTMRKLGKPGQTGKAAEYARGKYLKRVYGKPASHKLENATRTTRAERDANRKGVF